MPGSDAKGKRTSVKQAAPLLSSRLLQAGQVCTEGVNEQIHREVR